MKQPDALKKNEPLKWSVGRGTDVWELFCACIAGDLKTVKWLLEKDPSLARCHFNYRKPLYFAVRENRIDVAAFLLERDPDPIGLAVNDSLLEIARDRGYGAMERLLETKFAERLGASPRGEPVAAAIRERDLAKVRALLDASPELLHEGDGRSCQPIHWAVMTRQIGMIDELLKRGANIDAPRSDGGRPIHLTNGDYHYRGWRDVPDDWPVTPKEVYDHLLSRGANIDLGMACATGDLGRVRELLDRDPLLVNRLSDYNGYYIGCGAPIKNAAACGYLEIVRFLLERGADPNLPEEGIAPLHHFARSGNLENAALFLDHGADPNARDEDICSTPLGWAAKFGKKAMVELLLQRGGKPNLPDDPPWATSLAWATRRGHPEVAELLKRGGAQ